MNSLMPGSTPKLPHFRRNGGMVASACFANAKSYALVQNSGEWLSAQRWCPDQRSGSPAGVPFCVSGSALIPDRSVSVSARSG